MARESKRKAEDAGTGPLAPGLYLVATPIGNAADITLRALDVLARADALAAEDTRTTRRLMDLHGIALGDRPLVSYHDRNGAQRRPQIAAWLAEGRSVAYCSDAGTPLVADPGYRLAQLAIEQGHPLTAVPGPSAALTALTLSGLPSDRFLFAGFLPPKSAARRKALAELADVPATLILYESPRRAAATLADMATVLGPRPAALARELTKRFEEIRRGDLATLAATLSTEPEPKGELVLLAGPPENAAESRAEGLDAALAAALQGMSLRDAVQDVSARLGLPRKRVYARALELSDAAED
jgi:16S rRNA (cytidine1402-2'-O)-methyltransferase